MKQKRQLNNTRCTSDQNCDERSVSDQNCDEKRTSIDGQISEESLQKVARLNREKLPQLIKIRDRMSNIETSTSTVPSDKRIKTTSLKIPSTLPTPYAPQSKEAGRMARLTRKNKLQSKRSKDHLTMHGSGKHFMETLREEISSHESSVLHGTSLDNQTRQYHSTKVARQARLSRKRILQLKRTGDQRSTVNPDRRTKTMSSQIPSGLSIAKIGATNITKSNDQLNTKGISIEVEPQPAWNFGRPTCKCQHCGALLWREERIQSTGKGVPSFGICCKQGKIDLPPLKEPPAYLIKLLSKDKGTRSTNYRENIRSYNSMFAFTSMGGNVDKQINDGSGPYVFRMNGQHYHHIGTLLPEEGDKPRWAQLYIYDTDNEVQNRIHASRTTDKNTSIDPHIVEGLKNMLDRYNILAQTFRMARDRFNEENYHDVRLRLINTRGKDGRRHNMPSASEVAALIVNDTTVEGKGRDIIVQYKDMRPKRISETHPKFMAMQYPLLFPYGEDGYRGDIPYKEKVGTNYKRKHVTMLEYHAYRLQQRKNQSMHFLKCAKLTLQYIVDVFGCILQYRLDWLKRNQGNLRTELYAGLQDAIERGDTEADQVGKRIILPSSFTGSPRYKAQNYQDAMAICRWAGYPDLFVTFTCNANWPEIQYMLEEEGGQLPSERPDIVDRVFNIKLKELMKDIKERKYFGKTIAIVYTIEFQKRGLPHAHILIFLDKKDKCPGSSQIDKIISAEIPDNDVDPEAHAAVENFMMHGPCGEANPKSPCMMNRKCLRKFPKKIYGETTIDEEGFPTYKRRDDGQHIEKGGVKLDNRYVVPYNRNLLVKYQAHINVEWCNRSMSIKYLFKYINKGDDQATVLIEEGPQEITGNNANKIVDNNDEIRKFLECTYISGNDACWRIFQFDLHYREPSVERLPFHLQNQQQVIFSDSSDLTQIVRNKRIGETKFTQWMEINKTHEEAKQLTYAEFPTKWVWNQKEKTWIKRKKGNMIGRIYYAHPASGEKYYLRMLLNTVKGCKSFDDIRTVDGVVHTSYKSACQALGFLDDDIEWIECIKEASNHASGNQLRHLFTTILCHCEVTDPKRFWESCWEVLSEDMEYKQRKILNYPTLRLTTSQRKDHALVQIEKLMRQAGKTLKEYSEIELPNSHELQEIGNGLINEEMNYDKEELKEEHFRILDDLNFEQRKTFDSIMESVNKELGKAIFVDGYGGTGKTYLWKAITTKLRSEGKIVLAVASCGIAALLLQGGRTTHSRFHIPIILTDESTCDIKQGSHLAQLLKKTSLILWDEAPMANKICFEALDRSLRDILRFKNEDSNTKPFGGMTVVLGGDFRQILPVVSKGRRHNIVNASIKRSYLWQHFHICKLTKNMRLNCMSTDEIEHQKVREFAEWILHIGDGTSTSADGEEWVKIPSDLLLKKENDPKAAIVESIYPNLQENYRQRDFLQERAILCPRNETVREINEYIMNQIEGEEKTYLSCDSVCKATTYNSEIDVLYPTEFLNSLKFPGIPNHELKIKVGLPVMLLRNVNQSAGLCNGTRMTITQLGRKFIEAQIITGTRVGDKVYIPRIIMSPTESGWPFMLKRRQYPLSVCFAMTINKSQGQSLNKVGIYLSKQVFSHGQLYVAFSRVTRRDGLKIIVDDEESPGDDMVKNIVYKEIF